MSWLSDLLRIARVPPPVLTTTGPRPGDLVVYPGRYLAGRRVAIGHVGVVVGEGSDDPVALRARSMVGRGVYRLGRGGRKPLASSPFDAAGEADCSGYAAWAIGLDRYQPGDIGGDWISTDSIVRDARGPRAMFELVGAAPASLTVAHCHGPAGKGPAVSVATSALWARKKGIAVRLKQPVLVAAAG